MPTHRRSRWKSRGYHIASDIMRHSGTTETAKGLADMAGRQREIPQPDVFIEVMPDPSRLASLTSWRRSYAHAVDVAVSVPRLGLVVITAPDAESSVRIFAVGILRRGGKSLTWYRRYSVSSIHILENPLSEEELRSYAGAAGDVPSLRNPGLLSAASATELLVALEAARPEVSGTVSMAARYSDSAVDSGGDEVLTAEEIGRYRSDAGILSMRMRGFTLEQIREITPRTRGSLEEHLMRVDQEWFAGLQSQFGERPEFRIFDHPKGELTVIDSNRHRMERVLGVDLIYCCTWNRVARPRTVQEDAAKEWALALLLRRPV